MVTMSLPAALLIGMIQLRAAMPSTCTVLAPQSTIPHPCLVPVNCGSQHHDYGGTCIHLQAVSSPERERNIVCHQAFRDTKDGEARWWEDQA